MLKIPRILMLKLVVHSLCPNLKGSLSILMNFSKDSEFLRGPLKAIRFSPNIVSVGQPQSSRYPLDLHYDPVLFVQSDVSPISTTIRVSRYVR